MADKLLSLLIVVVFVAFLLFTARFSVIDPHRMIQTCGFSDGFVRTGIIASTYGQVSVNATRCMWNAIPFGQRIYASDRPGPEKVACDTRNDELSCSSSGERGAESVEEDTEVVATVTCDEFY